MTEDVGGYRSLSGSAVAALLLGILSPLAIANPLLIVIPIAGALAAIYAVRSIRANSAIFAGTGLALAGAFLSVAVIAYLPAQRAARSQRLVSRAEQIGTAFWEHLQAGRLYEAHQLHSRKFLSRDPETSLAKYYAEDKNAQFEFDRFYQETTLQSLVENRDPFKTEYLGGELGQPIEGGDAIVLQYRIRKADQAAGTAAPKVWLVVQRKQIAETKEIQWSIASASSRDPFDSPN